MSIGEARAHRGAPCPASHTSRAPTALPALPHTQPQAPPRAVQARAERPRQAYTSRQAYKHKTSTMPRTWWQQVTPSSCAPARGEGGQGLAHAPPSGTTAQAKWGRDMPKGPRTKHAMQLQPALRTAPFWGMQGQHCMPRRHMGVMQALKRGGGGLMHAQLTRQHEAPHPDRLTANLPCAGHGWQRHHSPRAAAAAAERRARAALS